MDSSNVSLSALSLNAAGFEHFLCDRTLALGINTSNIIRILKTMGKNDILTIKAEDEDSFLTLILENPKAKIMKEFEINLEEIDQGTLSFPDTPYKASVTMKSSRFQRTIRDLESFVNGFSDTCLCTIAVTQEGIRFSVSGSTGTNHILIGENGAAANQVRVDMEEPITQKFSLGYLKRFTKATPLAPQVILCFHPDMPMVLDYHMFDDLGFLKFCLAPQNEEEEDEEQ